MTTTNICRPCVRYGARFWLLAAAIVAPASVIAYSATVDNATVSFVAINGGSDTLNPGTSCIQIQPAADAACTGGLIYIPNNNKQLLSTALAANSSKARTWVYYVTDAAAGHCPGQAFTPCSLISLGIH